MRAKGKLAAVSESIEAQALIIPKESHALAIPALTWPARMVRSVFALKQVAPRAQTRGELIQPLGGSLLTRGLWYRAKLKNILGDFRDRPGFWSSLQDHIGFHDLATDWPQ